MPVGRLSIFLTSLFCSSLSFPQELITFPAQDGGLVEALQSGGGSRAVVLVHGGRFDMNSWGDQAKILADSGFRTLAINLRGYGNSAGPGQSDPYSAPFFQDVLAAVRHLRSNGAEEVSVVGASMGGWAAAGASIVSEPGEISGLIILAASIDDPPEKLKSRTMFIVARDDTTASGIPRLVRIRENFKRTPEPKELVVLEGSAHAQFLFQTPEGHRLMREILRFLTTP